MTGSRRLTVSDLREIAEGEPRRREPLAERRVESIGDQVDLGARDDVWQAQVDMRP